mgnify:CR=1 FL=1
MKTFRVTAVIVAASLSAFTAAPAFAQGEASTPAQGHYEWRQSAQYGPRAPLQSARRVWVPDAMTSSTAAAGCMKAMPGAVSHSGATAS